MSTATTITTGDLQAQRQRLAKQFRSAEGIAKAFARRGDTQGTKDWNHLVGDLRAELAQVDHTLAERGVVLSGWVDKRDLPWMATIVLCFALMGIAEVLG
jgi:hypothetical protein